MPHIPEATEACRRAAAFGQKKNMVSSASQAQFPVLDILDILEILESFYIGWYCIENIVIISPNFSSLSFAAILCHFVSNVLSEFWLRRKTIQSTCLQHAQLHIASDVREWTSKGKRSIWKSLRRKTTRSSTFHFVVFILCAVVWSVIRTWSVDRSAPSSWLINRHSICYLRVYMKHHETRFKMIR